MIRNLIDLSSAVPVLVQGQDSQHQVHVYVPALLLFENRFASRNQITESTDSSAYTMAQNNQQAIRLHDVIYILYI